MLFLLEDLVAPTRCGGCGDALVAAVGAAEASAWCVHCRDRWGPPPGWWGAGGAECPGWAAAVYRGPVRRAVLAAKRGSPAAAAELLLRRLPTGLLPEGGEIAWVPGHPLRTVATPDAGRVLAEAVAERLNGEVVRRLSRSVVGRRQARRSPAQRRADPHRLGLKVIGEPASRVVLVDDVRTTGTSLDEAARQLRAAGAGSVLALTVAAAPDESVAQAFRVIL